MLPTPDVVAGRRAVRAAVAAGAAAVGPDTGTAVAPGEPRGDEGPQVLVACSGGADSLALAACVALEGLRGLAVVVDHGLQPGSAAVADRAAAQCRDLGLEAVVVPVVVAAAGGPEAAARSARYAALEAVRAERVPTGPILLGHTLDDQAETVLLALARGSGARALAGMPAARGALRRPFLELRRTQTEQICADLGLTPWQDPTNAAPPDGAGWPLRSQVRASVLPEIVRVLGPGVPAALARTAALLRDDDAALEELADALRARATTATGLDTAALAEAPAAVRRRVLRAAAAAAGAGALTQVHLGQLDALVVAWHGQGPAHLPGGVRAQRRCGRLVLHTPTPA